MTDCARLVVSWCDVSYFRTKCIVPDTVLVWERGMAVVLQASGAAAKIAQLVTPSLRRLFGPILVLTCSIQPMVIPLPLCCSPPGLHCCNHDA